MHAKQCAYDGSGNMHKRKTSRRTYIHKYGVWIRIIKKNHIYVSEHESGLNQWSKIKCIHMSMDLDQINETEL